MKSIKLVSGKSSEQKYKNGYPLILDKMVKNPEELKHEGLEFKLYDEKEKFIGKGYIGHQNKGKGWILTSDEKESFDVDFFSKKINYAMEHRSIYFKSKDTNAFRIFNAEGDGIGGLTIDYFDENLLVTWYSMGIYKYRDRIMSAIRKNIHCKSIYQKKRFAEDGKFLEEDSYVEGEKCEFPLIVKENGVNFAVNLNDGAMVGVFLDQRDVRKKIRDKYSLGRTVLNTFSYTGAFSVFAALGGAKKTTSVDLANRSLPKTIEQFSVNNIDYLEHDILVEDVFNYFKYANRKKLKFDMVILDPPSFAKSKKIRFSAEKDYTDLLKQTISITANNGIIVASTNCSTFDMKKFKTFIELAFKESKLNYKILEEYSLPRDFRTSKDFREGNYLKVVFIELV